MAESLMDGLKGLFEEHNIAINEDTVDVVAELEEEVEGLKTDANARIDENIALQKEITSLQAGKVFVEVTEDLTLTQQERMKVLAEKLDFNNIEEYTANLNTLKESFFAEAKAVTEDANVEEDEIIVEDTVVAKPASDYYTVNALVEALNAKTHLK
jgi:regulator of replication initiation timing